MAEACKSTGEEATRRPDGYLEYIIDCPPCPREERRRLGRLGQSRNLPAVGQGPAAVHRRHRPSSTSMADEPVSLMVTPTTERTASSFDDDRQRYTEFQRRWSPFRRGRHHDRVRRPASATPMMSEVEPSVKVVKPRPLRVNGFHDSGTGSGNAASLDRRNEVHVCGLQEMIRHRRTSSNVSSSSSSISINVSVAEQHLQSPEQVTVSVTSLLLRLFHCHHYYHHQVGWVAQS